MSNRLAWVLATVVSLCVSCNGKKGVPDKVTFTQHVAPILYSKCTMCHRPGGTAHFALVTYEDARRAAGNIAFVTKERMMPPWPADPHYTEFVGQRLLSTDEIEILGKWANTGALKGPEASMPALPQYAAGAENGTPDMRIPVQPVFLKSNSSDRFLLVKVPFELP